MRIIGGGPAALAAAFELTSGACADKYDVTIYQPGWRLGGKCASGRNPADGFGKRIEEHGLHVFFGCYANTRQILDRCYEELNNSGAPYKFASFDDAFDPIDQVVLGQHADDSWQFVTLEFPRDQDSPNFGGFVSDAVSWISRSLRRLIAEDNDAPSVEDDGWWNGIEPTLSMLGVDTSETLIDDRLEQFAHGISRVHREMTRTFLDIAKADDPGRGTEPTHDLRRRGAPGTARRTGRGAVLPRHRPPVGRRDQRGLEGPPARQGLRRDQPPRARHVAAGPAATSNWSRTRCTGRRCCEPSTTAASRSRRATPISPRSPPAGPSRAPSAASSITRARPSTARTAA